MKEHFYLIRITDEIGNEVSTRLSKASNPREACKQAFGVVYDNTPTVGYKDIGTRSIKYLSSKQQLHFYLKEGWLPIPKA